ncbi:MAG: tandem-95 repeat protein [Pseudomonadota bacterium]
MPQLISDTIDLNLQIVRFRNNLRAVYDNVELVQVDLPVCAQVVEPVDMTRPQLSAVPNNLAVFEPVATTLETTDARIQQFLSAPIASDDREGAVPVIVTLENGSPLPNALPLGTTLVTFSAVDTAGNAALPVTRAITLGRVAVPQAFADQAIGDEDSLLVIDVLANDFAQNSTLDPLSILITEQPTQGSAVVDPATGRINYQPFANRNGNDQLRYTVADADGRRSSDAPVQIMVLAVNDAPSAIADSASTTESQSVLVGVLENDVDFDDALNAGSVVITQAPTNGQALTDFVTGGIVYTPNAGFIGTDTLLYQVQDSLGASSAATPVDVTVVPSGTAPNRAPIAANDFVTLAEDTSLAIDVLVNDADSDGALVAGTLTLVNAPLHGEVTLGPGGVLEYTPDVDYFGVDSFRYQVADEQGAYSLAATVFATVTPINDAPVANDDVALGAENQMTSVSVLANDSDVDGLAGASVVIDVPPLFGAAVWDDVSAQVRYTPNLNFSGVDYMDYRVVDSAGAASQPARVSINVEGVNNAPVASADAFTVSPTDATPLEVLANDTDAEQVLQHSAIRIVSPPSVGSVGYDAAVDRLVYTPGSGFIGTTTFTYDLTDDQGAVSNIAEVVLTIESVEAAPMANNDVVATVEDIAVVVDVIANDTDVQDDIDVTSVVIVTPPASGGAVVNGSTGAITYTPNANFFGDDTFSYQVADATGLGSNIATVSVQVGPVNDPPVASGDVGITDEDTSITLNVAANDTDIDSAIDLASIVLQSFPTHGVATPDTLGNVIYTPNANFAGDDSFSYRVADVEGQLSGTAQVTVTVLAVNDTPVAVDDSVTTDENNAVVIDVLANDVDSDGLADIVSAQLVTGASIGAVTPGADTGQFSYTPNVNANGVDQFTYQLVDAAGATSNAATVTITITPVPSAPVVLDSSVSTRTGASLDIDVLVGSSDPESDIDVDTVSIESPAANGTAVALPGGVVRYTPNAAFEGADAFTFLVRDATGLASNTATVAVTVLPPNMAPQANDDDTTVVFSGETIEIDLSGQVSDSDGSVDLSTLSVFNLSEGAAMVLGASGIVRVDVPDTFTGIVTFEYTVEDNEGLLSNTATVTTVVWPAEDPDFDGIGSSIEIAVGTDPDMADSVYVFIDPDTPTATPDGTTWELAYPSIKAAADDGKLVETPGNTLYVLMASNNDVVTVADEWQLEVSANCSNMTIVGSLDPFVATPRFNAQGAPQTKLESVLAGERPLTLTDCDVVNLYYVTLTGGHGNLRGGGAFLVDVAIRFDHVHVIDNAAENRGGGIFVDNDSPSRVHIENALIANNVLTPQANLDSSGGGLHMVGNTDLTIIDSIIRHNEALVSGAVTKSNLAGGGGLFIRNTPLYLTGSKIMANKTGQCGGGVYVSGTDAMRVEHSSVSGNEAQQLGGGVCMQNTNANLTLHNNLITSNYADTGAGFYVADVDKSVISNNTVVFNLAGTSGGAFYFDTGGDPVFNYNIGQFNRAGDGSDEASGGIGQILGLDANYNFISNFWVNFVGTGNSDDPIEFDNGYYQLTSSPGVDYGPIDSNNPLYALDQRYTDRQGITTDVGTLDAGFHYLNPQPLAPNNAQIETDGNLVQNLDNQSLRVTPLIGSEPLGPGHRLYLREPTGSVATHIYTYSGTTLDPLGTGGSTQLRDLGDGRYEVLLDIAAAQPDFELVLYIDSITTPFLTITVTQ